MNQIKCPNCGKAFTIDESEYESIVSQVKTEEFHKELEELEKRYKLEKEHAIKVTETKIKEEYESNLKSKDLELTKIKAEQSGIEKK